MNNPNPVQPTKNMAMRPSGPPLMRPPQGPRPPIGPGADGMAMTPKEIMGILRRHIWMIIIFTVLGTIIGGGSWFLCDRYLPRYTYRRAINVAMPVTQDPMQITTSQVAKDIYYQFRFTKAALVKQDYMLKQLLDNSDKVKATDWFKKYAKVNAAGEIIGDRAKAISEGLEALKEDLGASAPRDNNFIVIAMSCEKAKDAKDIVDEMVRIFLKQQQELARGGLTGELSQLRQQRTDIQADLDQVENQLASIRTGTRFARLNLGENQSFRDYMDEKLADLENRNSELETERERLKSIIATLDRRAKGDFDERVQEQVENDPIARQYRSNIISLEALLQQRLDRFGEDHRLVRQTQATLEQMRDALGKRQYEIGQIIRQSNLLQAEESMAALALQLENATQQLNVARTDYKQVDQLRNSYARLEVKRQESLGLLEEMNTLIAKKTAQHDDPTLSKLSSPYAGEVPKEKSFPNPIIFFPGGFILGVLAGIGLAFLVELMNDLLRTPSDVMRHLKVPLMGMVCHVDDDKEAAEGVDLYHVVRQAPYSIISECYRQLRTNLKLLGTEGQSKNTLLIASGQGGDGKTSVATNLAATLLAENRRVLLVDANFRRPSMSRLFPHSAADGSAIDTSDYGLSNYLMGQCDSVDQIIRESDVGGLFIIDSGPLPANPAELLSGQNMKSLLEHCKSNYDFIIVDGPAMLVSDAKVLATQADGTIFVFNTANTHRGAAIRMLREMREIHADVIGAVLMGVKSRKGGYFREFYRSYQDYQQVHVPQPV